MKVSNNFEITDEEIHLILTSVTKPPVLLALVVLAVLAVIAWVA